MRKWSTSTTLCSPSSDEVCIERCVDRTKIASGTQDVVIAGGVEVMSVCPIGSALKGGNPTSKTMQERWPGIVFSQFEGAEIVAAKHGITREQMEQLAVLSHQRGFEATKVFLRRIVSVNTNGLLEWLL